MKKVIITTGVIAVAGGVASALFMPSCDADCGTETSTSLIVSFVDDGGQPVGIDGAVGESVTYEWTDEGGNKVAGKAVCQNDDCSEWTLGDGRPGKYDVHTKVCGTPYDSTYTIEVDENGCVLEAKLVKFPVSTAACTDVRAPEQPKTTPKTPDDVAPPEIDRTVCTLEARPSVLVPVWTHMQDMMIPTHADRVWYQWNGEPNNRELPGICVNEDCSMFAAGFEHPGEYVLGAEVCGKTWRTSATVGRTADGCHVDTAIAPIVVESDQCEHPLEIKAPELPEGQTCQPEIWPSAIVFPVKPQDDFWQAVATEDLIWTHENERNHGWCAEKNDAGKCLWWITGFGKTGRFKASTEVCENESSVEYTVEQAEGSCYPKTEFVPVFVDTRGCITPATPGGKPPVDPTAVPVAGDEVNRG
jgi:hypothetical protein